MTYWGEHLTRSNTIVEAHPVVIVRILPRAQDVLIPHIVGLLVAHPMTPHDPEGVAAVEVPVGVIAVRGALIGAPLEVAAFVKDDLVTERQFFQKAQQVERMFARIIEK